MNGTAGKPKRSPRWFQFGLRTLLIASLVTSLLFAWIGIERRHCFLQKERIAAVGELNGFCTTRPRGPRWLHNLLGDDHADVVRIDNLIWLQNRNLKTVAQFPELEGLSLAGNVDIDDTGMRQLQDLRNLRWVSLQGTQVSGAGLSYLAENKELTTLSVEAAALDNQGSNLLTGFGRLDSLHIGPQNGTVNRIHLHDLPALKKLNVAHIPTDELVLERLPMMTKFKSSFIHSTKFPAIAVKDLPNLEEIQITDASACQVENAPRLKKIRISILGQNESLAPSRSRTPIQLSHVPSLESLSIQGHLDYTIRFDGWSQLSTLDISGVINPEQFANVSSSLEHLRIDARQLRDSDLQILRKANNCLKRVELTRGISLTNTTVEILSSISSLEYLQIAHSKVDDQCLIHLEQLPNLKHLIIRNAPNFKGDSLNQFDFSNLRTLDFRGCELSQVGEQRLREWQAKIKPRHPRTNGGL